MKQRKASKLLLSVVFVFSFMWSIVGTENIVQVQAESVSQQNYMVEINEASYGDLQLIHGVGPAIAERIIAARPFESVDDLVKVKGIGAATLQKIKDQGIAYVTPKLEKSSPVSDTSMYKYELHHRVEEEWGIVFSNYPITGNYLAIKFSYYSDVNLTDLITSSYPKHTSYLETRIPEEYEQVYVTVQEEGKAESEPTKIVRPRIINNPLKEENIETVQLVDGSWEVRITKTTAEVITYSQRAFSSYSTRNAEENIISTEYPKSIRIGQVISLKIPAQYEVAYITIGDSYFNGRYGTFTSIASGGNRNQTLTIPVKRPY